MKHKFILCGIILMIMSCSKDNEELSVERKIIGKWNWLESNGGMTGNSHYTPENTGDERKMIFLKDKTVYIILNGDTIHTTNYFTSRENSILLGDEFDFLTINYKYELPDTIIYIPIRYMIREITDELKLDEDVYDGYGHRYERLKN